MTRSPHKADALRAAGAEAIVADALDAKAVTSAVTAARPDAVIHQLTAIPQRLDARKIERDFALTDRLRTEGTRNLRRGRAGGRRERASSPRASRSHTSPARRGRCTARTTRRSPLHQRSSRVRRRRSRSSSALMLAAEGLVLRYGYFYGPGSSISARRLARRGSRQAPIADRRRRRGRVVVHPRAGRRAGDARGIDARRAGRLQRRRRRAGAGARVDSGARAGARREAAAPRPGLARAPLAASTA